MGIKRYLQEKNALFPMYTHTQWEFHNYTTTPHTEDSSQADNQLTKSTHYSSFQSQVISSTYVCKMKQYVPDFYSRETCLVYIKVYI